MSDRIAEIGARLANVGRRTDWVAEKDGPDGVVRTKRGTVVAETSAFDAYFIAHAPSDLAYLLERESQMMGALRMVSVLALHCCDAAIGRESLDECLRDFGLTLEEVEARDER